MSKPSTRMHEVYDTTFGLIRYCGAQRACQRFAAASNRRDWIVRVAGR
jgi:hypothetical protein